MVYPLDPEGCTPGEEQELKRLYPHFVETGHSIRDVIQSTLLNETSEYFLHDPEEHATISEALSVSLRLCLPSAHTVVPPKKPHTLWIQKMRVVMLLLYLKSLLEVDMKLQLAFEKAVDRKERRLIFQNIGKLRYLRRQNAECRKKLCATICKGIEIATVKEADLHNETMMTQECVAASPQGNTAPRPSVCRLPADKSGIPKTRITDTDAEKEVDGAVAEETEREVPLERSAEAASSVYATSARNIDCSQSVRKRHRADADCAAGTVRYRGVYQTPYGKWRALINISTESGKTKKSLGVWGTAEEAARAYDEAARSLHGDKARLNFPMEGEEIRYRGVSQTHNGRWRAEIWFSTESGWRVKYVGVWDTAEEAARAYDKAARSGIYGDKTRLNFPLADEGPTVRYHEVRQTNKRAETAMAMENEQDKDTDKEDNEIRHFSTDTADKSGIPKTRIIDADAEKEVDGAIAEETEREVPLERSAEAASLGCSTSARNIDRSQSVRKRHRADADCAAPTVRYRGVRQTHNGKWVAQISISTKSGEKKKHLGVWATAEEAARAYDEAARSLHGDKARLNFPMEGEAVRYYGVFQTANGKWLARICVSTEFGWRIKHLGRWATAEEAAKAYDDAARSGVYGDKTLLNFPLADEVTTVRYHQTNRQAETAVEMENEQEKDKDKDKDKEDNEIGHFSTDTADKNGVPSTRITDAAAEKEVDDTISEETESEVPLERSAEAASLGCAKSARNIDCAQSVRKRHRADADCAAPTVQYRGVTQTANGGWQARIYVSTESGEKNKHLGVWDTAEEAARVYDRAARSLHGDKAQPNFPMEGEVARYRGVKQRRNGRWRAQIRSSTEKTTKHLGVWDTAEEAARAFDRAARSFRGNKARLNFPLEDEVPSIRCQ